MDEILEKLGTTIKEIFEIDYEVTAETSADDVDEWDSISHIELITKLESVFSIRFGLGELQDLKNVGDMAELIKEKTS
jgi:acyl carrier protein